MKALVMVPPFSASATPENSGVARGWNSAKVEHLICTDARGFFTGFGGDSSPALRRLYDRSVAGAPMLSCRFK